MRIKILKKINKFYFSILFFVGIFSATAQCPTITNFNQSFCDSQNPTISSLSFVNNGGGIKWFLSATALPTAFLNPTLSLVTGVYYADDATGACGTRQAVNVTIYNPPVGGSGITVCVTTSLNEATVANLAINGNNIKWYATSIGGPVLSTSTVVFNNSIYYASQTNPNTGCETTRTPVVVTVKFRPPPPTGSPNQLICNDAVNPPTLANIVATNVYNWYATPTLGVSLPITTLLVNGQTYYADSYDNPCNSATRLPVTVTLSEPNNAGVDATKRICENLIPTTLPFDLFLELGGTPQNSGTWSGPIATSYGHLGTIDVSTLSVAGSPYVFNYTVANGACPLDVSKVSVIIEPTPTFSYNLSSQIICSGQQMTFTFTGTPNATVVYTENGIIKTVIIEPDGNTTLTQTYTENTIFVINSITSAGVLSCTKLLNIQIALQVIPLPTATISVINVQPICIGETNTLLFTGTPGATVVFHVGANPNQSINIEPDGTTELVLSFSATTVVTLVSVTASTSPFCVKLLSEIITINVTPLPTATIQLPTINPACSGILSEIIFNGTPNSVVTYTINGGNLQSITLNNLGTNFITGNFVVTTTFTLVSITTLGINPCSNSLSTSYTLQVNDLPVATISPLLQIACAGESRLIVFSGTQNATILYSINGVVQPPIVLNAGTTFPLILPFSVTTVVQLISVTATGTTDCVKLLNETSTVVVTPRAEAGNSVVKNVCSKDGVQNLFTLLGPNAQTGGIWTTPSGTVGNGFYNPLTDAIGVYTYTVMGVPPCPNAVATVTISLSQAPNAGQGGSFPFCSNSDSVDLFSLLTGNPQSGGFWSPTLVSGTSIFNPSIDTSGIYTYTVSGSGSCANSQASLQITITNGPNAGTNGTADFCSNPANLFAFLGGSPTTGGSWSPTLVGGIYNPAINNPGIYTYSFSGVGVCQSDSATVTVTENPVPNAGNNGSKVFCSIDAPANLYLSLTGNPDLGGVWTPALISGTGFFDPQIDPQGIYTYTIGGGLCPQSSAQVTVTTIQSPNVGSTGASLLVKSCVNQTSSNLFSGLNGSQSAGIWTDSNNNIVSNIVNPSILGVGDFIYTYTVSGGIAPCNTNSAQVTLSIDPIPNAGGFTSIPSICNVGGTLDLFSMLSGNQSGGIWQNAANVTVNNVLDLTTLASGIHVYTYSITNSCGSDSEQIQFTLYTNPVLTSANIDVVSPNCQDQNLTFNFTNMIDGNYTISLSISGVNTSPTQIIPLSIVAGSGNFTLNNSFYPILGTSIFTFSNITNVVSNCSVALSEVVKEVLINPTSDLADANLTAATKCFGQEVMVEIAGATGLINGNYQFEYSVANGGIPVIATTPTLAINNGIGNFVIPVTSFPVYGTYSITINKILNLTTGCNNLTENATTTVILKNTPNVSGAIINVGSICINSSNQVTISNATNLNGLYILSYSLSTDATVVQVPITFSGGVGSFIIPKPILLVSGTVTITILDLIDQETMCGLLGTSFPIATFTVYGLDTPILNPEGNQFCDLNLPTIASLNSNVLGTDPVIWYDTATLGTVYPTTTLLQNGTTYYATFTNAAGCESTPRLAVIVDLSFCDDLLIPDGFSPNDDTINDTFEIKNLPLKFPEFKLEIYNRYGNLVYSGDKNTPNWDGTTTEKGIRLGNEKLPVGVYFYILEFNDGKKDPKQGRVYLNR
jgi:mucin-2